MPMNGLRRKNVEGSSEAGIKINHAIIVSGKFSLVSQTGTVRLTAKPPA
jgi:hypothetical protein